MIQTPQWIEYVGYYLKDGIFGFAQFDMFYCN
jgi:hypothetical protein